MPKVYLPLYPAYETSSQACYSSWRLWYFFTAVLLRRIHNTAASAPHKENAISAQANNLYSHQSSSTHERDKATAQVRKCYGIFWSFWGAGLSSGFRKQTEPYGQANNLIHTSQQAFFVQLAPNPCFLVPICFYLLSNCCLPFSSSSVLNPKTCGRVVGKLWSAVNGFTHTAHRLVSAGFRVGKNLGFAHILYPDFTRGFTQPKSAFISVFLDFCPASTRLTIRAVRFLKKFFYYLSSFVIHRQPMKLWTGWRSNIQLTGVL